MFESLFKAILYVLPAYIANGSPVVGAKIIGKTTPLDRGARAWDGRRILGDGKTLEGLLTGIISGTLIGLIIYVIGNPASYRSILEPFLLSLGAMIGDIFGSFLKRRMGLERGRPAPGLDQLGFLIFALLSSFSIYGAPGWLSLQIFILLLAITACLHLGTNYLAYLLGLKKEPY